MRSDSVVLHLSSGHTQTHTYTHTHPSTPNLSVGVGRAEGLSSYQNKSST